MRVVLGVSGGIAAYKAALVLRLLTEAGHEVTVVPTDAALRFVGAPTWEALSGRPVATDVWSDVPEVPHVQLGRSADLVLVVPATADLLARAATGLADDLLTTTLLTTTSPVVLAPAMHTEMWQHPATRANVATLRSRGVHVIDPDSGRLTGADTGAGRLPEPERIVETALRVQAAVDEAAGEPAADLAGRRVLVTAGGTREALDPVRYLGNRSSGKQGYRLAEDAAARGADVLLVSTVERPAPDGVEVVPVESALQMREAVLSRLDEVDALVMAAAVADFRPARIEASKIKKRFDSADPEHDAPTVELVRNPDILAEAVRRRAARQGGTSDTRAPGTDGGRRPVIVGFAAETGDADGDVLSYARAKLERKGCDLLVANEVGDGVTFGQDASTAYLLMAGSDQVRTVGPADKSAVAHAVWDAVLDLFPAGTSGAVADREE